MRTQTFYSWLKGEADSSRMLLVNLYLQRDKLLYVEAPPLRQEYMDKIGVVETDVMEAELDAAMLERKVELIQIALNRKEPVDMEKIDAQIEEEKKQRILETEAADRTLDELKKVTPEESQMLQQLYRDIIRDYHPAMHPEMTRSQKELYDKASEAYKAQDAEALMLIYQALNPSDNTEEKTSERFEIISPEKMAKSRRKEYRDAVSLLATDYSLAKKLYACFAPLEEDMVVLDALDRFGKQKQALEEEIAAIREGFPFNAVSTLRDPKKTDEYLEELKVRAREASRKKEQLLKRTERLAEGRING